MMSILFSKSCDYALRSVIYLLHESKTKPILQNEMAEVLQIPIHFLGKILQVLVHHGLVVSFKGRNGGYAISQKGEKKTLGDVVRIMEGPEFMDQCFLGLPGCNGKTPCPYHEQWGAIKKNISSVLDKKLNKPFLKKSVRRTAGRNLKGQ